MNRTLTAIAATVALAGFVPSAALAQMTVVDPTGLAALAEQLTAAKSQLAQLKSTYDTATKAYAQATEHLDEAKRMTGAVTGARGLGSAFDDPTIRNFLPPAAKKLYDKASQGGYAGISGTVDQILASEAQTGSVADRMAAVRERGRRAAAQEKLIGDDGYAGAQARLAQLDKLQAEISKTQDPKAIAELQARLSVEQANIQSEATKLQLMQMMARAEEKLADQQLRDVSGSVISPTARTMSRF